MLDAAGSERAACLTYAQGGARRRAARRRAARADRRADHVCVDRAHIVGAGLRLGDDARGARGARGAQHRHLGRGQQRSDGGVGAVDGRRSRARAWFARMQRLAASPGEARIISRAMVDLDVREVLPRIRVPTLVMHRPRELVWDVRHSRYLAENIAGARYVELEGADSFPFVGDSDAIVDEIEEFLTGGRRGGELARGAADGDVHRHRRRDRARRRARRRALARPARTPRRGCAQGARALRRPRGQDGRRRLPGHVRRAPLARAALRAGDQRRRPQLGIEVRDRHAHRRVRADRRRRRRHGGSHRLARQRRSPSPARCSSQAPCSGPSSAVRSRSTIGASTS